MASKPSVAQALLFSGGMDSIALAFWSRPQWAITVDYGQRPARAEIAAATRVACALGIKHEVVHVDFSALGSGDLAGCQALSVAPVPEWWPFRNQLLTTVAAMALIRHQVGEIMLGIVRTDAAHADGTSRFVKRMNDLVAGQEGGIRITAPASALTSSQLIRRSQVPRRLLAWAHSCHVANIACGRCRGCQKYASVWRDVGSIHDHV